MLVDTAKQDTNASEGRKALTWTTSPFDHVEDTVYGFDHVIFDIPTYPSKEQINELHKGCKAHGDNEAAFVKVLRPLVRNRRVIRKKRFHLHVIRPDNRTIELICKWWPKHTVPYIEIAKNDITERPDLLEKWNKKHLRLKYNRHEPVQRGTCTYVGATPDSETWPRGRWHVYYADLRCKWTGLQCLHSEDRINGGDKASQKTGIKTGHDMLVFDHRAYWEKRLTYVDYDRARLGLHLMNQATGQRRRTTTTEDAKIASIALRANSDNIQAVEVTHKRSQKQKTGKVRSRLDRHLKQIRVDTLGKQREERRRRQRRHRWEKRKEKTYTEAMIIGTSLDQIGTDRYENRQRKPRVGRFEGKIVRPIVGPGRAGRGGGNQPRITRLSTGLT
jgi:hypothetical protein